jgi:hypothetical protein
MWHVAWLLLTPDLPAGTHGTNHHFNGNKAKAPGEIFDSGFGIFALSCVYTPTAQWMCYNTQRDL